MPERPHSLRRASGILLHPTSLPGPFDHGDFGRGAARFLDWLTAAGQQYWQLLPLGPTGFGQSPYDATSAFAGNPLLVSVERLAEDGLLAGAGQLDAAGSKRQLLRQSWRQFQQRPPGDLERAFQAFSEASEHAPWLDDWTLYAAAKEHFGQRPWYQWPLGIRQRRPGALAELRQRLDPEIAYQRYLQFLFHRQWLEIKAEANRRGIRIFGDIPIYVALDSAEVWSSPELFDLDDSGLPSKVAGVPPDYFSPTGQRWGNPTYRWDRMAETGFEWWIERLRANLRLVDLLRLDHFRGFVAYWEIDADQPTAEGGRWVEGPGLRFFETITKVLGDLPLVAEDLGVITPEVRRLRQHLGMPGMRVLQFGFDEIDSEHLPHNVGIDTVYYTGTHDNDTVVGWFERLSRSSRGRLLDYLGAHGTEIHWDMIRAVLTSSAGLSILPLQDVLGLGSRSRMNTPGVGSGNWQWRLKADQLGDEAAARLARLTELSGRLPAFPDADEPQP